MSVVVMGMEMPKDCSVCYDTTKCLGTGRCFEDGTVWCGMAKGYIGVNGTVEKCPLVELPEKHGDLVDRREMMAEAKRLSGPYTGDGWDNWGVYALIERQAAVVGSEGD